MANYCNHWIKRKFKELRKSRGGKCLDCGGTENLEFAHIKETKLKGWSRGRKERYYDIKNNPDSYRLMCRGCHEKKHNIIETDGSKEVLDAQKD